MTFKLIYNEGYKMFHFENKNIQMLLKGFSASPQFYNFLVDAIVKLDIEIADLEKLTKFKIKKISMDKKTNILKIFKLWISIEKVTKRSDIGIVIADYFTPQEAGLIGQLFLEAKNIKESVEIINRFLSIILGNINMKYYEVDNYAVFSFDISPRIIVPFSAVECFAKICYNWVLEYLGVDYIPIKEIHFYNKKPKHFQYYQENFAETKVFFNELENYILLEKNLLYTKNQKFSTPDYQCILNYATSIQKKMNQKNIFSQKITSFILLNLTDKTHHIKEISKHLDLSVSTIKRKLKEENTSVKKITEDIRKNLSKCMLEDIDLSYEDISFLLGYAEYSSFYRAFKKWYNITPLNYRKKSNLKKD